VKHAEALHEIARAKWDEVALVTGVVKDSERETIFNAVRDGNAEVLVATTPADEGLHPPPLRSLVAALSGKSKTRALQRIGGLMRPYPGKDVAIAFDTWDSAEFLYKQGEARKKLHENEPHWRIEVVEMRRKH